MPNRNRDSHPDFDRNWSRPGPDDERVGHEGDFHRYADRSGSRGDWSASRYTGRWGPERTGPRDYRDYGEHGSDEIRSFGGVPREYPHPAYPPYWMRDENPRQGFGAPHDRDRSVEHDWPSRDDYAYWGLSPYARYPYGISNRERPRGRFYGRGPKGYRRSDERIREEISDRLMTHPDVDASDVDVQVANGIVTLTGTVEDRHEKRIVESFAEDELGVDDVNNQLKVRHGFWASVMGEKATERELEREPERDVVKTTASGGRTSTGRGASAR